MLKDLFCRKWYEKNDSYIYIYMDRTINEFFEVVLEDINRRGIKEILCPCKKCENGVLIDPSTGRVKMHLLKHSFMPGYTRWTSHGEDGMSCEGAEHDEEQQWMMDGHDEQSEGDEYNESGEDSDESEEAKTEEATI